MHVVLDDEDDGLSLEEVFMSLESIASIHECIILLEVVIP